MENQWRRLEAWLEKEYPEILADLNPGCSQEQLADIEKEVGVQLSESVKSFYLIHDGQKSENYLGMFYDVAFLPLERMISEWRVWSGLIDSYDDDDAMRADLDEFNISLMPDKVKAIYANKKWIPFAVIWDNNYLGLDFDPEANGNLGQVINFGREEEQKAVLADSFESFIDWYISQLERGNYLIGYENESKYFIPKTLRPRFFGGETDLLGHVANRFIGADQV
jgi:cell wall assembly regulator SMI1